MPGTTGSHQASRWDDRTVRLLGSEAVGRLAQARMLVVGVGGVGGYAAAQMS